MPRVLLDPSTAECPDYTLDVYRDTIAALVNDNTTDAQAATLLATVWRANNTVERQQWQQQQDADALDAEQRRLEVEEARRLREEETAKERDDQRKEELKKYKTKFAPIPARGVPTQPPVIASLYATRRMQKGEFVQLWYYTNRGVENA
jgi:hypothetical protein